LARPLFILIPLLGATGEQLLQAPNQEVMDAIRAFLDATFVVDNLKTVH
jgi:hypothetical protein